MNRNVCSFTILALCVLSLSIALAQEEQKGPVKKAIDAADHAAIKGADRLDKMSQDIEIKIEKFANPPPHQGGQKNIVSSALSGVGRLLRNVSVEGGKLAGTVGVGTLKFSKGSAKAVQQTLKESAKRIVNPRRKNVQPNSTAAPMIVIIEQQLPQQKPESAAPVKNDVPANAEAAVEGAAKTADKAT